MNDSQTLHHKATTAALERNHYFQGKFMTAADFQVDQSYFEYRHRLQNQIQFGWGVACGLTVEINEKPGCEGRAIIGPGVAIDDYGREIVVEWSLHFDLNKAWGDEELVEDEDEQGESQVVVTSKNPHDARTADKDPIDVRLLCIEFHELEEQEVPVMYAESSSHRTDFNRFRQAPKITLKRPGELPEECFTPFRQKVSANQIRTSNTNGQCFPASPCGRLVPLALVSKMPSEAGDLFEVDSRGRTFIHARKPDYTTIESFSWKHGESQTLSQLRSQFAGEKLPVPKSKEDLVPFFVRFGKKLEIPVEGTSGLVRLSITSERIPGANTLEEKVINVAGRLGDTDRVQVTEDFVRIFVPASAFDEPLDDHNARVTITLNGDFLVDGEGQPVDVSSPRGSNPPCGTGTPGGQFTSWFLLKPEPQAMSTPDEGSNDGNN